MPAPEDLTVHTPGETLATAAPAADTTATEEQPSTTAPQLGAPAFSAKHNGSGRWKIWYAPTEAQADWFSDFVVSGAGAKALAEAEAERLNAGGEPYVAATGQATKPAAKAATAAPAAKQAQTLDPATLKQPVLTADGWLCPEPKGA